MSDVIRRGVAAWRASWFRPAPRLALAVARVVVTATALHLNAGGFRFASVAYVPAALWKPIPLVAMLGLAQPQLETVVRRLRPAYLVGGVLFHLGTSWLMNVSFFTVWILYLAFVPWARVVGMVVDIARRTPAPPPEPQPAAPSA